MVGILHVKFLVPESQAISIAISIIGETPPIFP